MAVRKGPWYRHDACCCCRSCGVCLEAYVHRCTSRHARCQDGSQMLWPEHCKKVQITTCLGLLSKAAAMPASLTFYVLRRKKTLWHAQDVEPGRPVRSQLASAANSPDEAFRRMKNKTFVVETKFDGQSTFHPFADLHLRGSCAECIQQQATQLTGNICCSRFI